MRARLTKEKPDVETPRWKEWMVADENSKKDISKP